MDHPYVNYSREELIEEIKRLKAHRTPTALGTPPSEESKLTLPRMIELRKTLSDVLRLLLGSDQSSAIDEALLVILKFFAVDRVYIGNFDENKRLIDFTHEVTREGIFSMREEMLRELSEEDIPWWMENIQQGNDIIVYDVQKMPAAARREQAMLQSQGCLSILTLPVFHKGKINGFIGFDSVRDYRAWNTLDIENLRMLADVVSIAIERERVQGMMEHSAKQVLLSEAKFQIIFDKLPLGVELYDVAGKLLDINQADLDIFGTTKEHALGLNMFENPNIPALINRRLQEGEDVLFTLDYNFQVVQETGYYHTNVKEETKHLQVKGVPLKDQADRIFGYLYIVSDDTENYHKAEQIRDSLAKLKVAVNTGESIMWEYDTATQKLSVDFSLNDTAELDDEQQFMRNHVPTSLDEFIQTLHPDDREKIYEQRFLRLVKGEIENYTAVYRRMLGDKLFWFSSNVRAYKFNPDGTPSKIVSYTSDITQQREKEIELIKVKEADKLKSAFLANMSHEIRTPLNAIVGFSNIIAEMEDKEEIALFLDIIHKNNELLLQLIDDILDFSKIEAGTLDYHIAPVDMKEICGEVALADSLKMGPEVQLRFDKNAPSVWVRTDARRIVQVVSNFVNNAIKFTSKGSITLGYRKEQAHVKVWVSDTGIGIREEDRRRIFERFVKANDFQQGTGLGLTISKTIIETLGGTIGVDSTYGQGATFWFTLPLGDEPEDMLPEDEPLQDRIPQEMIPEDRKPENTIPENTIPEGMTPEETTPKEESGNTRADDAALFSSEAHNEPATGNNEAARKPDTNAPTYPHASTGSPASPPAFPDDPANINVDLPPTALPRKTQEAHTILIAEDIEENYRLLHMLLRHDYRLLHAENGREAVALYHRHHPDLILMDIKMPEMDGFEATQQIRAESETVPIVALTAFAFEKEKQRARDCRFTDYLVKPVDIHELRRLIRHILG